MALLEQLNPVLMPGEVRLTRTPLGGGGTTVIVDGQVKPQRRIMSCSIRRAQSLGYQEADVALYDEAGQAAAWTTGDSIKVEARGLGVAAWTTLADGFLGPSTSQNERGRLVTHFAVRGWSAALDLIVLPAELKYTSVAWTSISDDIITQVLGAGFARSITPDAETPSGVSFAAGMKLREALDVCRRALNAGVDKWEHQIEMVAGVKTYRLYKRSTAVLRSVSRRALLPGSRVERADVTEVVNRAVVTGATVPSYEEDRLTATKAGVIRPSLTTQRFAQPIVAQDTPIAAVTLTAERSGAQDPPTLNVGWARNASGLDILGYGVVDRRAFTGPNNSLLGVNRGGIIIDPFFTTSSNTIVTYPALTFMTVATIDLGASPPAVLGYTWSGNINNCRYLVDYSDDNSVWTNLFTSALSPGAGSTSYVAGGTHRYWRFRLESVLATANVTVNGFLLLVHQNVGADATNPQGVQNYNPLSGSAVIATVAPTGAMSKELVKIDLTYGGAVPTIARIEFRHSESVASVSLNMYIQVSNVAAPATDADWTTIGILPSTTSTVEDTLYVEQAAFRWVRVNVVDDRAGGSAAITVNGRAFRTYEHKSDEWRRPLPSDAMVGGTATWDVTSLIRHPGTLEERTYSAPRLTTVSGGYYWMLLWLQSAATAYSWWDLDYSCSLDLTSLGAYLGFEEGSGTTAYDGSAYAVNGTYSGAKPPVWIDGPVGLGIELFSGNYVDFTTSNIAHVITTAGSMSVKHNPRAIGTKYALAGKGNGQVGATNQGSYSWFIDTDGKQLFAIWLTASGPRVAAKSNTALVADTNYTLGVKLSGGNCTFYLNGIPDGVVAMAGTVAATTLPLQFGRAGDGGAFPTGDGFYDEFYMFSRALSDAEFLQLHNFGATTRRLMQSPDSGATWFSKPADMLLRTYVAFNIHELTATVNDTASQTTYASLVPGGILSGGLHDDALLTQAAVTAEATALVNRRKSPPRRVTVAVPFDESLVPGSRVRLEPEAAGMLGLPYAQLDLDIVEASHRFGPKAATILACDEYPLTGNDAGDATIAYATGRTI